VKDPRTTEDLLRIERFASTLAVRNELERRGYVRDSRSYYVKEPLRNDWRQPCSDESRG
jgi:hypothetical protein